MKCHILYSEARGKDGKGELRHSDTRYLLEDCPDGVYVELRQYRAEDGTVYETILERVCQLHGDDATRKSVVPNLPGSELVRAAIAEFDRLCSQMLRLRPVEPKNIAELRGDDDVPF